MEDITGNSAALQRSHFIFQNRRVKNVSAGKKRPVNEEWKQQNQGSSNSRGSSSFQLCGAPSVSDTPVSSSSSRREMAPPADRTVADDTVAADWTARSGESRVICTDNWERDRFECQVQLNLVSQNFAIIKLRYIMGLINTKTVQHPRCAITDEQGWKTDRFLVPFRRGALFSVASYPRPGLSP